MRHLANGSIRVPETARDLTVLWDWLDRQHTIAVDTETTGLDIYSEDHRLRLIALATPKEAWVIPWETWWSYGWGDPAGTLIERMASKRLIMHNASYDIQVLHKHTWKYVGIEGWWSKTRDTKILAHQVDPRGREEGGIGQSLEELVKHYMPEYAKLGSDLKDEFQRLKGTGEIPKRTSLSDMWRSIPIDNAVYQLYAGTDAILTARLFLLLAGLVDINSELTKDDHKVAMIASMMDAKGFLLDTEYTSDLAESLRQQEISWKEIAKSFGLDNINSPQQVVEALAKQGLVPDELTPKGNPKVDKNFLAKHLDNPLVQSIVEGKKAGKWRTTWVEKFLSASDSSGRVHPSTNTLRARTARFSITGIPAQTLPSSDSLVRSCFVADTDEVVIGVDYSNQELRFAAAMAPDPRMIQAFRKGENLHKLTASLAFPGKDVSKGTIYYDYGKTGNFATAYGGGIGALINQTGMPEWAAKLVIETIWKSYLGLKGMRDRLVDEATKFGYITTWTGRKLPVDPERLYSALNYYIQSGCRDITAQAGIRLYDAGFIDHMRLFVHDEILFSGPADPEFAAEISRIMTVTVKGLEIPAEAKIGKRSWGSLYQER